MKSFILAIKTEKNNIRKYFSILSLLSITALNFIGIAQATPLNKDSSTEIAYSNRRVSSVTLKNSHDQCIGIHDGHNVKTITEGHRDHKPVWSKEKDMITFIRIAGDTDQDVFRKWRSSICVINADGSGFKELTDNSEPNLNPTWTKDGSNKIIFNRLLKSGLGIKFYWINPDAEKNSAERISHRFFIEWAECGLPDGRILLWRINRTAHILNLALPFWTVPCIQRSYLLDPVEKKYYPIKRSRRYPWHQLNMSPSGTKVTYMKDLDGDSTTFKDCVLAYADFNLENLSVENEVVITDEDKTTIEMYPKWTPDEQHIIHSSNRNGKMLQYIYSLTSGKTSIISGADLTTDKYSTFEDLPN